MVESEEEIIKRLKELGKEISKQDNRSTASPIFGKRELDEDEEGDYDNIDTRYLSLFESDIKGLEDSYVFSANKSPKMDELRELLKKLSYNKMIEITIDK